MSGVELDLVCPEIDVDDFSSVSKTNHNENSFVEEEQMSEETPPIINLETQASNDNILTKNIDSNEELTDSNSNYIPTEIIQENEATSINLPETPVEEPTITFNNEKELAALNNIFNDSVYFLIKSGNEENVSLAKAKGVWSTPPANENKLNRAFRQYQNVILIFSVAESKAFQGFARMSGEARHDSQPINWVLPPGMSNRAFSGVIPIDWVSRRSLPFNQTLHLFNSWNENKPVKIGRDGQEIEPRCAEALCRSFPPDPTIDIITISKKSVKRISSRSRSPLSINPSKDLNHHSSSQRSSNSIDRHRHQRSRSRERSSKESRHKRRHRSTSSHSDHGNRRSTSRKRSHRDNENPAVPKHVDKTMSHIMANGTYEDYVKYMYESQTQYAGFPPTMFPPTGYPMMYDPASAYPMGYDPHSMHSGPYGDPTNMYLPQPSSSVSQNASEYEQEINAFLRHTTSSSHKENDNGNKSHRNHHHYKTSSTSFRHRSKSREHRR
ncbi:unnamed protein product [Adineta steineri]|uniref:YTH domain-containing protein n=1 Tax=Adineta steineri TaxID=433720 RepID=A0A815RPM2_9BILA|nr:unnamed protein product [Adineta steineri]CAF1479856.1 unnamed protein product [Adineta steineri]